MNFNLDRDHDDLIKAAVCAAIDDKRYINGPQVEQFEENWAGYNHLPFAVGVGSGTDALRFALIGLGVGPGDEVITPTLGAAWAAQAVQSVGATNVFADVDPGTMLLDPDCVEEAITHKTRCIIPVHLFGQMAEMKALARIAQQNHLLLVEDAAQAHGATSSFHPPGYYSDVACFSHYPTKNLGCIGDGGSIVTRLPSVAKRARLLRDAGRTTRYIHIEFGFNSGLDEIQAAVLNAKLPYLFEQNQRRQRLATRYREQLVGVGDLLFQLRGPNATRVVDHLFVVRTERRTALAGFLKERGIPTLSHYPCPADRQPFSMHEALDQGPFPYGNEAARTVLSLPLWPGMTQAEQDTVIAAVKEFYA